MPIELQPDHQGTPLDTQGRGYPDFVKERAPKQWTQEEKRLYLDVAFSFIGSGGEHNRSAGIEDYFEAELRRAGLVDRLEEAGILPSTEQNPEKREETRRHLYAGAVLGYVFGAEILSLMQEPSSWRPWHHKKDVAIDPLSEVKVPKDESSLSQHSSIIVGKEGFNWMEQLSENGQKLYKLLIVERGDIDSLRTYAAEDGFDLNAALDECRGRGLVDESIPGLVRVIRRERDKVKVSNQWS